MLKHTETALRAILEADPSMTTELIRATINAANDKREVKIETKPIDTILTLDEVAEILKCTTRNVSRLGRLGLIRRVTPPGFSRALGYSADSVRALMAGRCEHE